MKQFVLSALLLGFVVSASADPLASLTTLPAEAQSIRSSFPSLVCRATESEGKLVSAMIRSSPWPIERSA